MTLQAIVIGFILVFSLLILAISVIAIKRHNKQIDKRNDALLKALKEARKTYPQFSFDRVKRVVEGFLSTGDRKRDERIREVYNSFLKGEKK